LSKDAAKAEISYKKAIELNPNIAGFYVSLEVLYQPEYIRKGN
jgi:hypothetical protein